MEQSMDFTFKCYQKLMELIRKNGYQIAAYQDYQKYPHPCILRHDVDMDLEKAAQFANYESKIYGGGGIKAVYFILTSSDFYNILSRKSRDSLRTIIDSGHTIGLHFDEMNYKKELGECASLEEKIEKVKKYVRQESAVLEEAAGQAVTVVSMHRPSREILEADILFPGMLNSYSHRFFHEFKYLSDSRMNWREDTREVLKSRKYDALHILTHPFWYSGAEEPMEKKIEKFLKKSVTVTYETLDDNFRDLKDVISREDLECRLKKSWNF